VTRAQYGKTALHIAMEFNRLEVARVLLDAGANASTAALDGHTALHVAAARWDADAVELLLAHGADVAARDGDGRTPAQAGVRFREEVAPDAVAVDEVTRLLAGEARRRKDSHDEL
jgi:ankyrin repeat protein